MGSANCGRCGKDSCRDIHCRDGGALKSHAQSLDIERVGVNDGADTGRTATGQRITTGRHITTESHSFAHKVILPSSPVSNAAGLEGVDLGRESDWSPSDLPDW
jgi:hypothetical protein